MPAATSLLLLSPDTIFSGVAQGICRDLALAGWQFQAPTAGVLAAGDVASLYRANRSQRGLTHADVLVERLFESGVSVWCTAAHPDPAVSADPFPVLRAIKGPSDPRLCTPSQLRRKHGATNPIMNLLHTSDSAQEAQWERAVLAKVPLEQARGSTSFESLLTALAWKGRPRSASGLRALHDLKTLACGHPTLVGHGALHRLLDEEAALLDGSDQVEPHRAVSELTFKQCASIEQVTRLDPALHGVFLLCRDLLVPGDGDSSESLLRSLAEGCDFLACTLALALDPWSRLVLECEIESVRVRRNRSRHDSPRISSVAAPSPTRPNRTGD